MERERTHTRHTRKTPLKVLAGGLLAGILFAACQGDNLFVDFNTTGQIQDADIPTVEIVVPSPLSVAAIPLGDSVLITVDLSDDAGVSSVVFEGLALRGDAALGTDVVVTRFESKTVVFVPEVSDTTISRYLLATPDSILETGDRRDGIDAVGSDTVRSFWVDVRKRCDPIGFTLGLRVQAEVKSVKVRGSSSMLRLGCLGDLLRFEKREISGVRSRPQ